MIHSRYCDNLVTTKGYVFLSWLQLFISQMARIISIAAVFFFFIVTSLVDL